jgi:ABC-type histidine transport system ATPase subunit
LGAACRACPREARAPADGAASATTCKSLFAARPRALLLDEVTSALDPELVGELLGAPHRPETRRFVRRLTEAGRL